MKHSEYTQKRYMIQLYKPNGEYIRLMQDIETEKDLQLHAGSLSTRNHIAFCYWYNNGTPYSASFLYAYINAKLIANEVVKPEVRNEEEAEGVDR